MRHSPSPTSVIHTCLSLLLMHWADANHKHISPNYPPHLAPDTLPLPKLHAILEEDVHCMLGVVLQHARTRTWPDDHEVQVAIDTTLAKHLCRNLSTQLQQPPPPINPPLRFLSAPNSASPPILAAFLEQNRHYLQFRTPPSHSSPQSFPHTTPPPHPHSRTRFPSYFHGKCQPLPSSAPSRGQSSSLWEASGDGLEEFRVNFSTVLDLELLRHFALNGTNIGVHISYRKYMHSQTNAVVDGRHNFRCPGLRRHRFTKAPKNRTKLYQPIVRSTDLATKLNIIPNTTVYAVPTGSSALSRGMSGLGRQGNKRV
ncbi:hypothetical protein BJ138DRAFT_1182203 [Hygrophoropsis aurantiaca]|uniref:Uncharacterized protein n=1 Tax=Hygrophoropsis aurantiaca TaxID=72124 RepID=A0ACB8A3I8_9AGAM|nr:hypothetical protein BJ138DRAFT_1182203 [Hygrophoropsis aurantiaca]